MIYLTPAQIRMAESVNMPSARDSHFVGARVLMLHNGGPHLRGTEACLIRAAKALTTAGIGVMVLRNNTPMDRHLLELGCTFQHFCFSEVLLNGRYTRVPLIAYARSLLRARSIANEFDPAAIYCSGGLPCQVGVPLGRQRGIPVVCHYHHPANANYYRSWLLRHADLMICPSHYTAQKIGPFSAAETKVVYNGVDTDLFRKGIHSVIERSKLGIASDAVVFAQVGQLDPHKRPGHLLRAFAAAFKENRRMHLLLIGSGVQSAELSKLAVELDVENAVTITGYVESVLPYFDSIIDVNCLVSREEGLGISILEGSAFGLPGIATNGSGLQETIVHGHTGYLVDENDFQTLVDTMLLLADDPALRASLGGSGRRWIQDRFSSNRYESEMVEAVQYAISNRAA